MHNLIVGITGSGKSVLARSVIVPGWRARGYAVLVLDPLRQPWSGATWQTDHPERFLAAARASESCVLIVDEAQETMRGTPQRERDMAWLATQSRNRGHIAYFIGQRAMQVPPNVRRMCTTAWCFRQSRPDAETLALELDVPAALEAPSLPLLTCLRLESFKAPVKIVVPVPGQPSRLTAKAVRR